jgi:predicted nucleic acid-binding protein
VIVVTDTSVVLNLCRVGLERLLPDLFGEVLSPPSVAAEFQKLAALDQRFGGLLWPPFIRVVAPSGTALALRENHKLHSGEIEALSLAAEQNVDLVLMDERAGRAAAAGLGLGSIGNLGILIQAKKTGSLPEVGPVLDNLQSKAGFWISPSLRLRVLGMVQE